MSSTDDKGPHDGFVKQTFQSAEHAASLLRSGLPPDLSRRIDWDTLEQVPTEQLGNWFDKRYGDLLFRARLRGVERLVYIDVMLEHQMSPSISWCCASSACSLVATSSSYAMIPR